MEVSEASIILTSAERQLEAGDVTPRRATLQVIRRAFELAGVELIEGNGGGPGVRLNSLKE